MSVDRTPAQLSDMLGFVRELQDLAADTTLEAFRNQRVLTLAVERLFINLGEAAQRVPAADRDAVADVPWRQIIGLRNILAHGYERVDQETLYRTITTELAAGERALVARLAPRGGR